MPRATLTPSEIDRIGQVAAAGQRLSLDLDRLQQAVTRGDAPEEIAALIADVRHTQLNAFCKLQLLVLDPERHAV